MKKCICYYKESDQPNMSSVHMENAETSMCMYISDSDKHVIEFLDESVIENEIKPELPVVDITSELIALRKAGFTASEIIELKQSKLI